MHVVAGPPIRLVPAVEADVREVSRDHGGRLQQLRQVGLVHADKRSLAIPKSLVDRVAQPVALPELHGEGQALEHAAQRGETVPRLGVVGEAVRELQEDGGQPARVGQRPDAVPERGDVLLPGVRDLVRHGAVGLHAEEESVRRSFDHVGQGPGGGLGVVGEVQLHDREPRGVVREEIALVRSRRVHRADPVVVGVAARADEHPGHQYPASLSTTCSSGSPAA